MSYADLTDLVERAGNSEILQVADRNSDGAADPDVVDAALATADQTIDAYLASRFTLPLAPVPSIVKKWAVSFARYHLHRDGPPDNVVRDYKDAMSELKDAAAGRMALPGAAGTQPVQSQSGGAMAAASPATFTDQALEGWR